MSHVDRVIFNFNDFCPNNCGFCYTPFNMKGPGSIDLWLNIFKRINDFSPRIISIAGGDPLYYDEIYNLIENINTSAYINIDTCGLFLNDKRFSKIGNLVKSVGIPFDDSDSMIHRQRFSRAQCNTVVHNVGILHKCGIKIVAHTLLTPINIDYVRDIAEDIVSLGVHNWSIYQFWPFHFIADCLCRRNLSKNCRDKMSVNSR